MNLAEYQEWYIRDEGHWYVSKVKQYNPVAVQLFAKSLKLIMASTTDANNIVTKKSTATKAALNNRREMCYANEITGKGNDGNLSMKIKLAYTAPTMSTLPIIVLLAVYMNVYYEKLGASLTYIRYVVPDPISVVVWVPGFL